MSWDGNGVFNRIYSWVADAAAGLDISATRMDTDTDNITSNGFGNCLTRDGQGSATANLPMNSFKHTNVAPGSAPTDYARYDQLTSALAGGGIVPSGGIIMWSGSASAIPTGWYLCNGGNGTPNLQDRFVIGAGNSYNPGQAGGNASVTISTAQMPVHNHGININDPGHGHSINDPGHTHNVIGANASGGGTVSFDGNGSNLDATTNSTTGITINNNTTGITATSNNAGSGSAIDIRPPYYALCFIMKS